LFAEGVSLAQSTAFTYQGRLTDGGTGANGAYDVQFKLYDALALGNLQGSPDTITKTGVNVSNGVFTVQLYFGANAFPGADRFLDIGVKHSADSGYTPLLPRQQLTSTPNAIRSLNSANSDTAANATQRSFWRLIGALANDQFVDKLFQTTGVTPTASERSALIDGLNANPATETRGSVLFKIVDGTQTGPGGALTFQTRYGQVFYHQQFNPAFVQMEYFGYMKRDADEAGYAFWLSKLNQYPSFVEAEMVLAFISSPEYRARFGQP
jgi:hypothetical protein